MNPLNQMGGERFSLDKKGNLYPDKTGKYYLDENGELRQDDGNLTFVKKFISIQNRPQQTPMTLGDLIYFSSLEQK